jgi:hypothetical protein
MISHNAIGTRGNRKWLPISLFPSTCWVFARASNANFFAIVGFLQDRYFEDVDGT